ncbi:MAG TPA: CAP domain-containing protein [Candidatus Limnocylindrales bacterium]|jgi:uncharacterized protein YkwD
MRHRPQGRRLSAALTATLLATILLGVFAAPTSAATSATEAERMIIGWINRDRSSEGLVPLVRMYDLSVISGRRAKTMAGKNVLSHTATGNLGSQLNARRVAWYRYGEDIGYTTAAWSVEAAKSLYRAWKGSAPHWQMIMSDDFNYIGVGLAYRSSNKRTFGSIVFTESPDRTGAVATGTSASRNGDDVRWSWKGADVRLQTHTAGLRDFDVQYRVGSGSWVTLYNDTGITSLTFPDRLSGRKYGLRVRATDRRGNIGGWTAEMPIYVP